MGRSASPGAVATWHAIIGLGLTACAAFVADSVSGLPMTLGVVLLASMGLLTALTWTLAYRAGVFHEEER